MAHEFHSVFHGFLLAVIYSDFDAQRIYFLIVGASDRTGICSAHDEELFIIRFFCKDYEKIIHGMDEAENGHIYVAAVREMKDGKDLLKISVQDDGKGISDEMMQALNNDDVETLKGHLGLNNVNTIIRLYYGKEYGIMAFRPTAGGTVMIVTLPYSEDEPENTDHNDNGEPQ